MKVVWKKHGIGHEVSIEPCSQFHGALWWLSSPNGSLVVGVYRPANARGTTSCGPSFPLSVIVFWSLQPFCNFLRIRLSRDLWFIVGCLIAHCRQEHVWLLGGALALRKPLRVKGASLVACFRGYDLESEYLSQLYLRSMWIGALQWPWGFWEHKLGIPGSGQVGGMAFFLW